MTAESHEKRFERKMMILSKRYANNLHCHIVEESKIILGKFEPLSDDDIEKILKYFKKELQTLNKEI